MQVKCSNADNCESLECDHRRVHEQRTVCSGTFCADFPGQDVSCRPSNGERHIGAGATLVDQQLDLVITCLEAINDSLRNESLNVALRKLKEINSHASYN